MRAKRGSSRRRTRKAVRSVKRKSSASSAAPPRSRRTMMGRAGIPKPAKARLGSPWQPHIVPAARMQHTATCVREKGPRVGVLFSVMGNTS